jgi:protein-tyrosine phosphatase
MITASGIGRDATERARRARQAPTRDHAPDVIDLHCHLLPGIDDGPRDMRMALAVAQLQVDAGVETVAATPHVSWDLPTGAEAIASGVDAVRAELAARRIPLHVVTGGEIDVHRAAELTDDELRALALGGGPWLLLEAPLQTGMPLEPVAFELIERGHRVLIAHPERSPLLQRDPAALRRLADAGALTQVTAGSLTGRFGRTVQRYAEALLEDGLVHTVASDAHDALRRPPGMHAPMLGELAPLLTREIPALILAGGEIPSLPSPRAPRRRGLRALLGGR